MHRSGGIVSVQPGDELLLSMQKRNPFNVPDILPPQSLSANPPSGRCVSFSDRICSKVALTDLSARKLIGAAREMLREVVNTTFGIKVALFRREENTPGKKG
jgi:hypothetical protein